MHIRSGDVVQVMTGDDKGKRGKVMRVFRAEGRLLVEGINRTKKHVKPNRRNPQGGQLSKELPIDASNVMLICPQSNQPTRVGVRALPGGGTERYSKKSGASMGAVAPPKSKKKKPVAAGS
jgi:large subunit ribosomal protein L24